MQLLLQALVALFLTLPPGLPLNHGEHARVAQGGVVAKLIHLPQKDRKQVLVLGLINASPDKVWQVLTDYERYPKIFNNLKSMEILEKKGLYEVHRVRMKTPWPFEERWITSELRHSPDRRQIRIRRLEGNVQEMEGTWTLSPQGQQTLLVYHIQINPGLPVIPQWLIDWGSKQVAPDIIRAVRREAERL